VAYSSARFACGSKVGNYLFFQIFALRAKIWKKKMEKELCERARLETGPYILSITWTRLQCPLQC
jgi:hypothetical protein